MGNEVSTPVRIQQNVFELPVKLPVLVGPLDDGGVYKGDLKDSDYGYAKEASSDYTDQDMSSSKVIILHHDLDDNELNKEEITSDTVTEQSMNRTFNDHQTREDNTGHNNKVDTVPLKMMNIDTIKDIGAANQNENVESCQKRDMINVDNSFKSRLSIVLSERIKRNSDSFKILSPDFSSPENISALSSEKNVVACKENEDLESVVCEADDLTELTKNDCDDCGNGTESSHVICQKTEHPVLSTVNQLESVNNCHGAECKILQEQTSENSVGNMEEIPNSNAGTECNIEQDKNEIQSNNGETESENQVERADNLESKILQEVIQKEKEKRDITVKEKQKKKDSFKVKFKELTKRYKKSSKKQGNVASTPTVCHEVPTNVKVREIQNEYDYKPKYTKKNSDKESETKIQRDNLPECSEDTSAKTVEDLCEQPNILGTDSVDVAGEYVTLSHLDLATVVELDSESETTSDKLLKEKNENVKEYSDSKTDHKCNDQFQNQNISEEKIKIDEKAESQVIIKKDGKNVPSVLESGTSNISCIDSCNIENLDSNVTNSVQVKEVNEYEKVHNDHSVNVSEPFKTSDAKVAAICKIDSQIYEKEVPPAVMCSSENLTPSYKGNKDSNGEIGGSHVKTKENKKSSILKYLLYMEPKKPKKKTRKKEIPTGAHENTSEATEKTGNEGAVHLAKSTINAASRTHIENVESASDAFKTTHSGELKYDTGIEDDKLMPVVPSTLSEAACELKEYEPKDGNTGYAYCRNAADISEDQSFEKSCDIQLKQASDNNMLPEDDTCNVSESNLKTEETTSNSVSTTENRSPRATCSLVLENVQIKTNKQAEYDSKLDEAKHVEDDRISNEVRLDEKQTEESIDTQVVKTDTVVRKDYDVDEQVIMRRKVGDRQLHSTNSNSEIQKPKRKNSLSARISGFFSQSDIFRTSSGFKRQSKKKEDIKVNRGSSKEKLPVNMNKRYSEPDLGVQSFSGLGFTVDNRVRMEPNGEVSTTNDVKRRPRKNKTKVATKKRHSAVIMQGIGMDDVEFQFKEDKRRSLFDEDFKLEEFSDDLSHDVISLSSLSSTDGDTGSTLHIAHVHSSPDQLISDNKELESTSSTVCGFSNKILSEEVKQLDCEEVDHVKDSISERSRQENVNIESSDSPNAFGIIQHVTSDLESESETTESTGDMAGKFLKNTFSRKSKNSPVKCSKNGKSDTVKVNGVCKEKTSCSIEVDETEAYIEERQLGIIDNDCATADSQQNNPSNDRCNLSDKQSHLDDQLPEGDVVNDTKHTNDKESSCKSKSVSVCNSPKQSDDENGLKPVELEKLQNLNMEELSVQKVQMFDENPKKNKSIYRSFSETEARGVYCTNPVESNPTIKLSKGKSRSSSFSDFWRRPSKQKVLSWKSKSKSKDGVQRQPIGNVVQSSSTSILYM